MMIEKSYSPKNSSLKDEQILEKAMFTYPSLHKSNKSKIEQEFKSQFSKSLQSFEQRQHHLKQLIDEIQQSKKNK